MELAASLSADRYRPSSFGFRLSALFLDREKKEDAFPLEEALDLSYDDMARTGRVKQPLLSDRAASCQ